MSTEKLLATITNCVSEEIKVPVKPDNWMYREGEVQFIKYKGVNAANERKLGLYDL